MKKIIPLVLIASLASGLYAKDNAKASAKGAGKNAKAPKVAVVKENPNEKFAEASALVQEGKCAEAIAPLLKVSNANFDKPIGEKASVVLAECYLREHKRQEVADLSSRFLEYYVKSVYRERMQIAQAVAMTEQGSVMQGLESILQVLMYSKNQVARSRAKEVAIQILAASLLNSDQLQMLLEKYPVDKDIIGWMQLQIGRESQNAKRYSAARYWYKEVLATDCPENLKNTAKLGLQSLEGVAAGTPVILVMGPFSGASADFGIKELQGVTLALEKAGLKDKINIRLADTRADGVQALTKAQKIINQDSVIAIVGPIMSDAAKTVAVWMASQHPEIPMITPTATDDGIGKLGPNIFQVNVSMGSLAQGIASYAVRCLDIKEFGALDPIGGYSTGYIESFSQAVERLGGSMIGVKEYKEGKSAGTELNMMKDSRASQLARRENIAKGAKDPSNVDAQQKRALTSIDIPGMFIPASSPKYAGQVASNFAASKIKGTLLGTVGWYGPELFEDGKTAVEGAYFSTARFDLDSAQSPLVKFGKEFQERWNEPIDISRVAALSYDAANIVFSALEKKSDNLARAIGEMESFAGVAGEVKFKHGANVHANIVTVKNGKFELVDDCAE